jgi:hypothetical protein
MFVFFPRTAGTGLISADFSHSVRSSVACCGIFEPLLRFKPLSYPGLPKKFKKKHAFLRSVAAGGTGATALCPASVSAVGKKSKER